MRRKKEKKPGDHRFFISKDHWEKLAPHFATTSFRWALSLWPWLGGGVRHGYQVEKLTTTPGSGLSEQQQRMKCRLSVEQWNAMFPNHAIDVEAQKKMLSQMT